MICVLAIALALAVTLIPEARAQTGVQTCLVDGLRIEDALRLAQDRPARQALAAQHAAELERAGLAARQFVPRVSLFGAGSSQWTGPGTRARDAQAGARTTWQGPWGTRLQLEYARPFYDSAAGSSGAATGITIVQPLLRGAGPQVAAAQVRGAERARQAASWQWSLRLSDDAMTIAQSYVQALAAQQRVALAEDALATARQQQVAVASYVAAGLRAAADERQVRFFTSQQEAQLHAARSAHASALLTLSPLIGCRLDARVRLQMPALAGLPEQRAPPEREATVLAEIALRELALVDAQEALDVARNGLLPDLSVSASMRRARAGASGIPGLPDTVNGVTRSVGLTLEIPLNDDDARTAEAIAAQRLLQAEGDLAQGRIESAAQIESAALLWQSAQQQLLLAREQVRLATEVQQDEDTKLRAGRSSLLEWQTAAASRVASQGALDQAILDAYLARLNLWRVQGRLLQSLGLAFEDEARRAS